MVYRGVVDGADRCMVVRSEATVCRIKSSFKRIGSWQLYRSGKHQRQRFEAIINNSTGVRLNEVSAKSGVLDKIGSV